MPSAGRSKRRGLTLVEMMVAVVVGGISVLLAAKVAQVVLRQNVRSREVTDLSSRSRLLTHQIRTDIRAAGLGSTGAIGVDAGVTPWSTIVGTRVTPIGGYAAIPAMMGADGIDGASVGGVGVQGGSDALQLIVADGTVRGTLASAAVQGGATLELNPADSMACESGYALLVDSSSPQGSGRTQIFQVTQPSPWTGTLTAVGSLQFTAGSGSTVYCARLSTYWVDVDGNLHRSDLQPTPGTITPLSSSTGHPVYVDSAALGSDLMSPGVHDLQLAFRVSSEVYAAPPAGAPPDARWVFEGNPGNPDAAMNTYSNWFETRAVRAQLLLRTLRRGTLGASGPRNVVRVENAVGVPFSRSPPLNRDVRLEWMTMAEVSPTLRLFDKGAVAGVPAEPY